MANWHAQSLLQKIPDVKVVALVDVGPGRDTTTFKEKYFHRRGRV